MRPCLSALVLLSFVALSGCGQGLSPEEQALQDERDIALVEQANAAGPPAREISPEPIGAPDIERHDLSGQACNYAPGTSLGTRVIAREADAWMKIDGEMVRFAADPGSREMPGDTRSLYNGKTFALQLAVSGEGKPAGTGTTDYEGTITLRDAWGREVYEGSGLAQCSG
ncbi:MAG: hypothetical protein WA842_10070 [Croceibacterium sp.]